MRLDKPRTEDNTSWKDLFKFYLFLLGDKKKTYLFYLIIVYIANFYAVVPYFILGKIVDFFIKYKTGEPLFLFFLYSFILGSSSALVAFIRLTIKNLIGNLRSELNYEIKVKAFEKLLDFSLNWHDKENSGNKVQRIKSGVGSFNSFSQVLDNQFARSISAILGMIIVFAFIKPLYIVFFIFYLIVFFYILIYFNKQIEEENLRNYQSVEKAGGSYIEGLSNILTIKTLGANESFKNHIAQKEEETKKHEFIIRKLYNYQWKYFQIFNGISYSLFLIMLGYGVLDKSISTGAIVIFYGYLSTLVGSAIEILGIYEIFLDSKVGMARMKPIFEKELDLQKGTLNFPTNWEKIKIENGNFKYQINDEKVTEEKEKNLYNINIKINKNQKIGIVGKTGSGKSTLAKVLMGLYKLNDGNYLIDNTDFNQIKHSEIVSKIALVLQDSEMFNFSLKDNITLMKNISSELLQKAIEIAQLKEVVEKLPQGLNTLIGEKGYHLSGGERQRVGIARIICKNPDIIILDEATSSLDNNTEEKLQNSLEKELSKKTLITIAHRITTLRNVDIIYVFENGKIVETGKYNDLINNKNSEFYKIYKLGMQNNK